MKKILAVLVVFIALFSGDLVFVALAAVTGVPPPVGLTTLQNPIRQSSFTCLVITITKAAVEILSPFVVLAFIYAGFLFVKAQGNQKELDEAKDILWYSAIGAFVLMGAWGFAQIISTTLTSITGVTGLTTAPVCP